MARVDTTPHEQQTASENDLRQPLHIDLLADSWTVEVPAEKWEQVIERFDDPPSARTYVVVGDDGLLVGYLALAATGIGRQRGPFHRDMPNPVPAVLLARLAVATGAQGHGLGRALVEHAWRTCRAVSEQIGVCGLVVDDRRERHAVLPQTATLSPSPPANPLARILMG